jgi:hypothetical protein
MARRRSLVDRAELSRNHLCLPFRIKRDAEDGVTPIAQELNYGQCSLRGVIARSQRLDDDVWSSFALRTSAIHSSLPLQQFVGNKADIEGLVSLYAFKVTSWTIRIEGIVRDPR